MLNRNEGLIVQHKGKQNKGKYDLQTAAIKDNSSCCKIDTSATKVFIVLYHVQNQTLTWFNRRV